MLWARAILGSRSREIALILRRFQASDTQASPRACRLYATRTARSGMRSTSCADGRCTLSTTSPSESVDSGRVSTFAPAPR